MSRLPVSLYERPLAAIVAFPPLAASRTPQPLIVAVCALLAVSLFGSGRSGARPRVVCAEMNVTDNSTAAQVAPSFALVMMPP
ncbi:MAG: hypothetical protein DMF88_25320 [Acidobacteria bacterium]|nr:MAG: hypothetical protein DMF88_25320 [Acidobacteriota bacterium]